MANNKHLIITEYQRITTGENLGEHYKTVTQTQFDALEAFVLSNELEDASNYLKLGQRGNQKFLQAQNYIGVIQLKEGLTVEILPKIARKTGDSNHDDVRSIVINMLKTLRDSPFKQVNTASLKTHKMPLLELFISMFMQATEQLIRRGIRSDYIPCEENSAFLKGKLLFSQNLKHNLVHKERFYVAFDNYLPNRLENRLIKNTLLLLYKLSASSRNQQRIREALFIFDDIDAVRDVKSVFSKLRLNRQMKDYEQLMAWSRLFLLGNSFTPHKGNAVAFSLLFNMNMLFESYVGAYFKKHFSGHVSLQHRRYHLAKRDTDPIFALRPDIVIDSGKIVTDAKWKLLDSNKSNAGISQADMYQMYAYATKYQEKDSECEVIYLIYPATENTRDISTNYSFEGVNHNKGVRLKVVFFDLTNDTLNYPIDLGGNGDITSFVLNQPLDKSDLGNNPDHSPQKI